MKAFLFPGQGSQEVGMGADLWESSALFRDCVRCASECVGEDLEAICRRGPEKKLRQTRYLQPLLVAVSLGYTDRLLDRGIGPDVVLGHSLGEISALAAAGIVSPEVAVRIAAKRGELMDAAASRLEGGMLAVTEARGEAIVAWLEGSAYRGRVALANDNSPGQIVLSGDKSALAACSEWVLKERLGVGRLLSVSGPWHSPSMAEAAHAFGAWLLRVPFSEPAVPLIFNATAAPESRPDEVRRLIAGMLAQPVQWRQSMTRLRGMNPGTLLEAGPGRVLSGLARANGFGAETRIVNVNNLRGVEQAALLCDG